MEDGLVVAPVWTIQVRMKKLPTSHPHTITFHHCNGGNHFAKDCIGPRIKRWKPQNAATGAMKWAISLENVQETNQGKISQCQPSPWTPSELGAICNYCTHQWNQVQPWWTQVAHGCLLEEHFVTPGRGSKWMCSLLLGGVRLVQLGVSNRYPIDVEVLVIDWKLLVYDSLLGADIIKRLDFPQLDRPLCTTIINETNFYAVYDLNRKT